MQIIRERQDVPVEAYSLDFVWNDRQGGGFSFSCDKQGTILRDKMHPEGLLNLEKCLSGEYNVTPQGIRDYSYIYQEPAQGRCVGCGRLVELIDPMTNTCDMCGLEYNGSGQLLAPRSQWEEPWDED